MKGFPSFQLESQLLLSLLQPLKREHSFVAFLVWPDSRRTNSVKAHNRRVDYRAQSMDPLKQDEDAKPSVLSLMIDQQEAIEKTVSLIKKELTPEIISDLAPIEQPCASASASQETQKPRSEEEFKGLTTLLEDRGIQSAIKVVAGNDTQEIIDKALVALKSSETIDGKSKVFSEGIKKLHANLSSNDKSKLHNDPLFNLAIGLVGLKQTRRG